jgi:CRISPR/Cas system-associated endonuclease/helicase Cas3
LIQRAGRLARPHGKLTLTISAGPWIKNRMLDVLKRLQNAA